jgi:hypothetical protein
LFLEIVPRTCVSISKRVNIPNEVLAVFNSLCGPRHNRLGTLLLRQPIVATNGEGRLLLGLVVVVVVGVVMVVVAVVIVNMSKPTTGDC